MAYPPKSTNPPLPREDQAKITHWLETQRGRPQYRTAPLAGRAASKAIKPLSKRFKGHRSARSLIPVWPKIVGARWAKLSKPEKFTGPADNRTLLIRAPGAAASLIMASASQIIDRINQFLGAGSVRAIRVLQTRMTDIDTHTTSRYSTHGLTPKREAELQSGLDGVGSDALKQALEDLGRAIMTRPMPR